VALGPLAVRSSLRSEKALVLEMEESIDRIGTLEIDVPSLPSVSAAGTPFGHKFLPAEGDAPVASAPGDHKYFCAIDEQGLVSEIICNPRLSALPEAPRFKIRRETAKEQNLNDCMKLKKKDPKWGPGKTELRIHPQASD